MTRAPLIDVVGRNFRKHERAIASPGRPFQPFVKTGGHPLQLGIGRHNLIEGSVEFLNVLGESRYARRAAKP